MSHYEYRASVYRLALDDSDPRRYRRHLAALRGTFASPMAYAVTGDTVTASAVDAPQ
jgi:hypothetical protein